MSTTIDQKVLEMRFNNKQFEENVSESISTLDKLKGALNFDKVENTFGSITSAAGKVDFSSISSGVESVIVKFNALEIAVIQAISNIISNGINKLASAVNSLTFDQVNAGWEKFEEKTGSVQTIMAATGLSVEEVNAQLERLNWFSDETSYSFTDMTSNVGKFTSIGVELEDAVTAMQGIATWCALSGGNANEAARAMYNLSQAMGVGAVKLMDWRSIENAGMATAEFKEVVLETAASMGTLTKFADGTFQTIDKGTDVSIKNFSQTLNEGWFSAEVLMAALEAYGNFANDLAQVTEKYGGLTSNWIDAIDEFGTGTEALDKLMEETGMSAEELLPILEKLSGAEYELGRKAFKAAQEAKTFTDAIEATKDAVSTQWMNTFEYLFGDYEEAKEFFTGMTEIFYNLFAESGNTRNEILKQWSNDGFGAIFRQGILDSLQTVSNVFNFLKGTFQDIFPEATVENTVKKLEELTESFGEVAKKVENFTAGFKLSEHTLAKFRSSFAGLGAIANIVKSAFSALSPAFAWIKNTAVSLGDIILSLSGHFGQFLVNLDYSIRKNETFAKIVSKIGEVISPVTKKISEFISKIQQKLDTPGFNIFEELLGKIREKLESLKGFFTNNPLGKFFDDIGKKLKPIKDFLFGKEIYDKDSFINGGGPLKHVPGLLEKIGSGFTTIWGKIKSIDLSGISNGIMDLFRSIGNGIKNIFKDFNISNFLTDLGNGIANLLESLGNGDFSKLFENLTKSMMIFGGFKLGDLFGSGSKLLQGLTGDDGGLLGKLVSPLSDIFGQLKETIGSFTKDVDNGKLTSIAVSIGILAASLVALSTVDSDKIDSALVGIAGAMITFAGGIKYLSTIDAKQTKGLSSIGFAMIEIAAAIAIMVSAVKPLASMNANELTKAIGSMVAILGAIAGFIAVFGAISRANMSGITDPKNGFFSLFQKSNGFDKQLIKVAEAMVLIGAAMKIFASAMKDMGAMNLEQWAKGLGGVTIVLAEIVGFTAVVSKLDTSGILKTATAMVVLGAAMKIFASALKNMGDMNWEQWSRGIIGMSAVMLEMVAFIAIVSGVNTSGILKTAAAMVVLGVAMKTFASAMKSFGEMETEKWVEAMKQMGLVLAGMLAFVVTAGLVAAQSGNILVISASMIVLGLAMKTFASAAKDFIGVQWSELGKIAAVIAGFVASLVIIGALAPILASAVGVLTGLGVALMAVGAGITLIGIGISALNLGLLLGQLSLLSGKLVECAHALRNLFNAKALSLSMDNFLKLCRLLPQVLTEMFAGAIAGIVSGFGTIISSFTQLIKGIKDIILSLIDLLVDVAPPLIDGICKIVIDALASLAEHLPEMLVYIADIIVKLLDGLTKYLPQIIESLVNFVCKIFDTLKAHIPKILSSFTDFAGALFGEILKSLNNTSPDAILKLIEMVGFLDILIISCAALSGIIPGAMAGLVEFGLFVGELGLAIAALGTVYNDSKFLQEGIEGGGNFLEALGESIGKFLGGFVGGTLEGVSDSLPAIGTNLSTFMTNVGPFIEGVSAITSDTMTSITNLATALLALTAADLIGGIAEFITGKASFEEFGTQLASFGPNFKKFANYVDGINADSMSAASAAIASLAETFSSETFKTGGWKQAILGETSITAFAAGLVEFGPKLRLYALTVKGLDTSGIGPSCSAIETLATAFDKDVFKKGGWKQAILGDTSVTALAGGLAEFGPKLVDFGNTVKAFDDTGIEKSTTAITKIAEAFNSDTFKSGGLKQWIEGQTDFKTLVDALAALGPSLLKFSLYVSKVDDNIATKSTNLCTGLKNLLEQFPAKSLWQEIFGQNGVSDFVDDLVALGQGISDYNTKIADVNTEKMESVTTAVKNFLDVVTGDGDKGFYAAFNTTFTDAMYDVATNGITDFVTAFEDPANLDRAQSAATALFAKIVEGLGDETQTEGLKEALTTPISESLTSIEELAPNFLTATVSIMTNMQDGANSEVDNFKDIFAKLFTDMLAKINEQYQPFFDACAQLVVCMTSGVNSRKAGLVNKIKMILDDMKRAIDNMQSSFSSSGSSLMYELGEGINSAAGNVVDTMYNIGTQIAQGLANGMYDNLAAVEAAAAALANAAAGAASSTLGVQSPSKVFYKIGSYTGEGFVNGLCEWVDKAKTESALMGESVIAAVTEALSENIQNDLDTNPVIRPVLDLKDVEEGSKRLNTMFSTTTAMKAGAVSYDKPAAVGGNSINNSRNFGGFTFNIYTEGGDAEGIARQIGVEVNRRIRQFSTI